METLNHAASDVAGVKSVRVVTTAYVIDIITVKRFIIRTEQGIETTRYSAVSAAHQVLPNTMEQDLAAHIRALSDKFYGIKSK